MYFIRFSPILSIATYGFGDYIDGSRVAVCLTAVDTFWPSFFFVGSISVFFILPFLILVILYTVIARHLMNNPGITSHGNRSNVLKYRKQVIFMLGAVVLSFFVCLLPFRALTLWIIIVPPETIISLGIDGYYSLLYFCRIMLYLNSAMNPILYNLMSSKFREGFLRLLGCKSTARKNLISGARKGTFHTTSTNLSSSQSSQSGDKRKRCRNPVLEDAEVHSGSVKLRPEDSVCEDEVEKVAEVNATLITIYPKKPNGIVKRKRSTFDDIEELDEISPNQCLAGPKVNGAQLAADDENFKDPSTTNSDKEVYFSQPNENGEHSIDVSKKIPMDACAKRKLLHRSNKAVSMDSAEDEFKCNDLFEKPTNGNGFTHSCFV